MKYSMAVVVILLIGVGAGPAAASCFNDGYENQLFSNGNRLQDALNNKRILATGGGEAWNEDHCSNGNLFKVGVADDPVDPRAFRGTWFAEGSGANSLVTYNYTVGGTSSFSWELWQNGAGGLCWENPSTNDTIATAPAPGGLTGTCDTTPTPP